MTGSVDAADRSGRGLELGREPLELRHELPDLGLGLASPRWKDTVLVRTGEIVDILLDLTNPGIWMAHCHIAEHHERGMMFSFHVDP